MMKLLVSVLAFFSFLVPVVALDTAPVEATLSSCQARLLTPTYAGGYAYCSSGFGGSVRVKIWCNNGVSYYGPKVYFAGVTSTKLCPSGTYVTGATHILGS